MKKPGTRFLLILLAAILFVLASCQKEEQDEKDPLIEAVTDEIHADSLRVSVQWLESFGTRSMLAANRKGVAEAIRDRFLRLGYTDACVDSFYCPATGPKNPTPSWQYNVIATLAGEEVPDRVCIVGAHYDNTLREGDPTVLCYGANDNASGVAAVLEMARVLKKNSFVPSSTIRFIAFAAEEYGLNGSRSYCDSIPDDLFVDIMINLDMVARAALAMPALWYVNIMDYPNSSTLYADAARLAALYTPINTTRDNTYNQHSDSYSFSQKGIKALFFFSHEPDPYYHTLEDVSGNCNFAFCREVTTIACALLVEKSRY